VDARHRRILRHLPILDREQPRDLDRRGRELDDIGSALHAGHNLCTRPSISLMHSLAAASRVGIQLRGWLRVGLPQLPTRSHLVSSSEQKGDLSWRPPVPACRAPTSYLQ
jgi:hypothetical protein